MNRFLICIAFVCVSSIAYTQNYVSDSSRILLSLRLQSEHDSLTQQNANEALEHYAKQLELIENEDNSLEKAQVLSNLGTVKMLLGDFPGAIVSMKKALYIYDSLGAQVRMAHQLIKLGSACYFSNLIELNVAREYFEKARSIFENKGLLEMANYSFNFVGYIEWAEGNEEAALEIHKNSYYVFDSINSIKGKAVSASDIGFTLNSLARYQEALEYNQLALKLSNELDNTFIKIPILNNIAISLKGLGDYKNALSYSNNSLSLAQEQDIQVRIAEALKTLYQINSLLGDYEKAFMRLEEYMVVTDSLTDSKYVRNLTRAEQAKEYLQKEHELKLAYAKVEAEDKLALEKASHWRNLLLTLVILLSLIAYVLYRNYRLKSSKEAVLKEKNEELERLLFELKETQAKLIQYEKLASLGVLVNGVDHEINNPLNFILGGIDGLKDIIEKGLENEDKEVAETVLSYIAIGSGRIHEIITDLKDFSNNSINKDYVACNVEYVIDNILLVLQPKIDEKTITINTKYSENLEPVLLHSGSLHQILSNVILNAIQAIEGQGEINILATIDKDMLQVVVQDNGVGMAEDVLKQVFDPFFTTRVAGQGTGLGMYISYKLTIAHKGNIEIDSTVGVGTTVQVKLPIKGVE